MTRDYICGYYDLVGTYYDVGSPPTPVMYAYPGERLGPTMVNGMKGKANYNNPKDLWFITCDEIQTPKIMYLVRAVRNSDGTVTLTWKQIPLINQEFLCCPNQVTTDKLGNVYFPSGYLSKSDPNYWVAKVTNAQDPDPANWIITWHQNSMPADGWNTGAWGISLSKDHSTLVTYVDDAYIAHSDFLAVISTSSMVEVTQHSVSAQIGTPPDPYNIETDVSGGLNDNWAFLIRYDEENYVLTGLNMSNPAAAHVDNALTEQSELTVSIKTTGEIVTGDPTNLNETVYPVIGNGVVGVGVQNLIASVFTLLNHDDIIRNYSPLLNARFWADGSLNGAGGMVEEVTDTTQNTRVSTSGYRYTCTAADREDYD